ncbi:MAG: hypothetical protein HY665_04125 [Chloroflexi bacterium]|nr:hypothetical protein [Chloroflexota bacterium]
MGDIKSALEIAMEKVEKLGEATEEERLSWKYVPEGKQLAGKCLKEDCNLLAELGKFPEKAKKYVAQGAAEILIRNIALPKNDVIKKANRKAMDNLKLLKSNKASVENTYSKIRYLFNHYAEQGEQQRKQAHAALKNEFEAKVQQAMQQQYGGMMRMKVDVERQPQFQEEWRRVQNQLDSQYIMHLNEYKRELSSLA